jgi:hypothetical protein
LLRCSDCRHINIEREFAIQSVSEWHLRRMWNDINHYHDRLEDKIMRARNAMDVVKAHAKKIGLELVIDC